ncbi:ATP-binding protein [Kordia sp.]|uniref:tetratricopeptide repeat-containing sensor histidine kinase n=1 Tax=Kordia sp. TaxID=1965332 RepID=UPI003D28886B
MFYADTLYETAKLYTDTLYMAKARSRKGLIYKKQSKLQLSYKNYLEAKELYLSIDDSLNVGKKLNDIANLEKSIGNFGASQLTALDGLVYAEKSNDVPTLSGLYFIIAVAAKEKGDLKIAEKRIDEALALAKTSSGIEKIKPEHVETYKNTKANILQEIGEYDLAVVIYENLLIDANSNISEIEKARIRGNLAYTLFLKNNYNKRSDSLLKSSLSIYKELNYTEGFFSIYLKLAKINKNKDRSTYKKYVADALKYARESDNENSLLEALELKMSVDFSDSDLKEYVEIGKRIKLKEQASESLIANAKYDYKKEENQKIKAQNQVIISENDKILAEKKTAQSRNLLLIVLLIFIVTIVIIYFIYQKIKRRHKIEKVKTVHTTEARISSKVHDELANDVYKLMTQLETSEPNKEMVLDKLDSIYNNARDISKQIQNVDTGKGFPDELNNLLRSYQSDDVNVLLKRYEVEIWKDISSHIKTTIYRVLQELLTNMKKHSDAALVVVSIEKANKKLFIQYIDNGKGFSEEISKNGLQNAENRIHAIQGSLTFDTELHKGCKFTINVPV